MATSERGPLAGRALARLETRAAQRRPSPRTDGRQALSIGRVQGEGRLDVGARIFARGAQLRGYGTHQVASFAARSTFAQNARRLYSAGAGGASGATGRALAAGPPQRTLFHEQHPGTRPNQENIRRDEYEPEHGRHVDTGRTRSLDQKLHAGAALGHGAKAGEQDRTHDRDRERARERAEE